MPLVKVVAVTCPRHGDKAGLWQRGELVPFPLIMDQRAVERAQPLCFECKANGVRRNCTVVMEPLGEIGA